jgi:hypothetical protein
LSGRGRRALSTPGPAASHHYSDATQRRENSSGLVRQNDDDGLFVVRHGAYSPQIVLPGEEPATGLERRNVGMERASRAADYATKVRIRQWAEALPPHTQVTAEDARAVPGADVIAPAAWGAVLAGLARQGILRRIGYVQAERPAAHARIIGLYERTA